jgi:hypothetical protein
MRGQYEKITNNKNREVCANKKFFLHSNYVSNQDVVSFLMLGNIKKPSLFRY